MSSGRRMTAPTRRQFARPSRDPTCGSCRPRLSIINNNNGNAWKPSGNSKIVGQETVTTKAGSFDVFKVETSFSVRNVNNPTNKGEITFQTWFAPAVDHWVKRVTLVKSDGYLRGKQHARTNRLWPEAVGTPPSQRYPPDQGRAGSADLDAMPP